MSGEDQVEGQPYEHDFFCDKPLGIHIGLPCHGGVPTTVGVVPGPESAFVPTTQAELAQPGGEDTQ